ESLVHQRGRVALPPLSRSTTRSTAARLGSRLRSTGRIASSSTISLSRSRPRTLATILGTTRPPTLRGRCPRLSHAPLLTRATTRAKRNPDNLRRASKTLRRSSTRALSAKKGSLRMILSDASRCLSSPAPSHLEGLREEGLPIPKPSSTAEYVQVAGALQDWWFCRP